MIINEEFMITYLKNYLVKKDNVAYKIDYISKFPDKLYRFRKCKLVEFKSIEQNYIWLCPAGDFEDITDSTIKYNFASQKVDIFNIYLDWLPYLLKKTLSHTKYGNALSDVELNKKIINEYKMSFIDNKSDINFDKLKYYLLSKGLNKERANLLIDKLNLMITSKALEEKAEEIVKEFESKMKELRNYYYVTCFTETYVNSNLWQTYADEYSGFCIEYNFNKEVKQKISDTLFNFAPMFYGDKKAIDFIDIFRFAKNKYCGEPIDKKRINDLELTMHLHSRTKDETYDHEKEWRFYQDNVIKRDFYFPYISKIFLGMNIKPNNRARIINLAKKNNFKVYQQVFNNLTSEFFYKIVYPENI